MRRPNNDGLNISSAHFNPSAAIGAQNMLENMFGPLKERPEIIYVETLSNNSRAHYDAINNVIRIRQNVRARRTLVHEYGHAYDLQGALPDWARYAADVLHHVSATYVGDGEWGDLKLFAKLPDEWELAWALHSGENIPVGIIPNWNEKLKHTNMFELVKHARYLLNKEEQVARAVTCIWWVAEEPECLYGRVLEKYAPDVYEIIMDKTALLCEKRRTNDT